MTLHRAPRFSRGEEARSKNAPRQSCLRACLFGRRFAPHLCCCCCCCCNAWTCATLRLARTTEGARRKTHPVHSGPTPSLPILRHPKKPTYILLVPAFHLFHSHPPPSNYALVLIIRSPLSVISGLLNWKRETHSIRRWPLRLHDLRASARWPAPFAARDVARRITRPSTAIPDRLLYCARSSCIVHISWSSLPSPFAARME